MTRRLAPLLIFLSACTGETAALQGKVLDHWGHPIEGVTIAWEGHADRPQTDADGLFKLPLQAGTYKLKAGADGYIQDAVEVEVADLTNPPTPSFKLWERPKETGFHVVGPQGYAKLEGMTVKRTGTEVKAITGIGSIGSAQGQADLEVVFHTDLREDEIARFGLKLAKLTFVKEATLPGPLGDAPVKVNLYTRASDVDLTVTPLGSKADYLLKASDLEPGTYAFYSMGLLSTTDFETFGTIPDGLRVAFPLSVE